MGSYEAGVVAVGLLLPGALYIWAFERVAGRWGVGLGDRVLRFVGGSAVFHAAVAPVTLHVLSDELPAILDGGAAPVWLWPASVAYVVLPTVGGTVVGQGVRRGWSWTTYVTGPDPAPRAWDHLFGRPVDGWVRLKLKSGTWLGGAFAHANGRKSYASGYPEAQEIYLAAAARIDAETGEFVRDEHDNVELLESGILVRWEEVEHLEFIDA